MRAQAAVPFGSGSLAVLVRAILVLPVAFLAVGLTACSSEGAEPAEVEPSASTSRVADQDRADGGLPEEAPPPGRPSVEASPSDDDAAWLGQGMMTETSIELFWAELDGATGYEIHRFPRAEVADPQSQPLTAQSLIYSGTELTLVDGNVSPGDEFWYVFVAVEADQLSNRRFTEADAVTDIEPPAAPTGFEVILQEDGTALLTWSPADDNYRFARYAIRRAVDDEQSVYYGTGWTMDQTTFVDDQLPPSGVVHYQVRTVDFHGNSSEPAVASLPITS